MSEAISLVALYFCMDGQVLKIHHYATPETQKEVERKIPKIKEFDGMQCEHKELRVLDFQTRERIR